MVGRLQQGPKPGCSAARFRAWHHQKERYGGHQVAFVFVIQSLPSLLFSTVLARRVPEKNSVIISSGLQVIGVLALALLWADLGRIGIYMYLLINSLLQTVLNPVSVMIAGKITSRERWAGVHTRLTATSSMGCLKSENGNG